MCFTAIFAGCKDRTNNPIYKQDFDKNAPKTLCGCGLSQFTAVSTLDLYFAVIYTERTSRWTKYAV